MMRNGQRYSVGVRKPDGSIAVMEDTYISMTDKHPFLKAPLIRGVFSFVDSMVAPLSLINALLVALAQKLGKDVSNTFAELEDIWNTYGVFGKVDDE